MMYHKCPPIVLHPHQCFERFVPLDEVEHTQDVRALPVQGKQQFEHAVWLYLHPKQQ